MNPAVKKVYDNKNYIKNFGGNCVNCGGLYGILGLNVCESCDNLICEGCRIDRCGNCKAHTLKNRQLCEIAVFVICGFLLCYFY
jgi:hypothetical protein